MNMTVHARPITSDQTSLQYQSEKQRSSATTAGMLRGRTVEPEHAGPRRSNHTEHDAVRTAPSLAKRITHFVKSKIVCRANAKQQLQQTKNMPANSSRTRVAARSVAQLIPTLKAMSARSSAEAPIQRHKTLANLQTTALTIAIQENRHEPLEKLQAIGASNIVHALDQYLRKPDPVQATDRAALHTALTRAQDKLVTEQVQSELDALSRSGKLNRTAAAAIVSTAARDAFTPFILSKKGDARAAMNIARSLFEAGATIALASGKRVEVDPTRLANESDKMLLRQNLVADFSTMDPKDLQALSEADGHDPKYRPVYAWQVLQDAKKHFEVTIHDLKTQLQVQLDSTVRDKALVGAEKLESMIDRLSHVSHLATELRAWGDETTVGHHQIYALFDRLESVLYRDKSLVSTLSNERLATLVSALKNLGVNIGTLPTLGAHCNNRHAELVATYQQTVAPATQRVSNAVELAHQMQILNSYQNLADQANDLYINTAAPNGEPSGPANARASVMEVILDRIENATLRSMATYENDINAQKMLLQ